MRHRIKSGKVGSYTPEKLKVEGEEQEAREVSGVATGTGDWVYCVK